nr:MAG TPA: hypothetical protein [Caudoviricetes sp.]
MEGTAMHSALFPLPNASPCAIICVSHRELI